jgi:hypothetical protein
MTKRPKDEHKILDNIMNKNILINFRYLKRLSRNVKGDDIVKVNKIIELYASRKIAQLQTAENIIIDFLKSSTDKQTKSINSKYDKLLSKHTELEPLTHRLRLKTSLRNETVVIDDPNSPKTEVKVKVNPNNMINDNHKDFDIVSNLIKNRLNNGVKKVFKIKKSMKIQSVLEFIITREVYKSENGEEPTPQYPDGWVLKEDNGQYWEYKIMTSSTKVVQPVENDLIETLQLNQLKLKMMFEKDSNNFGSSWMLDRFKQFSVSCFTIKPPRASSYIKTPTKYAHNKCGLVNIKNEYDNKCFKWCMLYHQTQQVNNDFRTSVLSKIDDKYDYTDITFPVDYSDIRIFEKIIMYVLMFIALMMKMIQLFLNILVIFTALKMM